MTDSSIGLRFSSHGPRYADSDPVRNNEEIGLFDYCIFNKIKSLVETLTSIGQLLRHEELVSHLLNGLDEEYDSLVESIISRDTQFPSKTYTRGCFRRSNKLIAADRNFTPRTRSVSTAVGKHRGNPVLSLSPLSPARPTFNLAQPFPLNTARPNLDKSNLPKPTTQQ